MSFLQPVDVARRPRRIVWGIVAVGVPILLLAGCVTAVAVAITGYFKPGNAIGWVVGDGKCQIDPSTGNALVQLPVTSAQKWTDSFRLEPLGRADLILMGVASLAEGQSLEALDQAGETDLRNQLDDRDDWAEVTSQPTNVVLELHRTSQSQDTRLNNVTFWWSSGEPAFVQDVTLNLVWTGPACGVATH